MVYTLFKFRQFTLQPGQEPVAAASPFLSNCLRNRLPGSGPLIIGCATNHHLIPIMRASLLLRSAAQASKSNAKAHKTSYFPYEVWPLFVAMGFVCAFAGYRMTKNLLAPDVRRTPQGPAPSREPEVAHDEHH